MQLVEPFCYKNLHFWQATSRQERIELIEFRRRVYGAEYGAELIGTMMDEDQFDEGAALWGARRQGETIGTLRCVIDGPAGLPLEREARTRCDHLRGLGLLCEVGRMAIQHQTGFQPFVLSGLLQCSIWYAVAADVSCLVCTAPEKLWPLYRVMRFVRFGEPFRHAIGEAFFLAAVDLGAALSSLAQDLAEGKNRSALHDIVRRRGADETALLKQYLARRGLDCRLLEADGRQA